MLGFQFPPPWPDETGFIAAAFALARTGSFFDAGLNPDRVVMWMPPGYMVLLASVFRVFGYSFAAVRWVSTCSCLVSLGLAGGLACRLTQGWPRVLAGWAVAVAFLSPFTLMAANVGRMDMLLAALMLLALVCVVADRPYCAASLAAAGLVVHFNAIYFMPPVAIVLGEAAWRGRLQRADMTDLLAGGAAAFILLLYGAQVLLNWDGFRDDMAFQFSFKHFVSQNDPTHPGWPALCGTALAALAVWRAGRCDGAAACALFGVAFLVMAHNGHEFWYDFAQPLGCALISIALLAGPPPRGWIVAGAAAVLLTLVMAARITPTIRPLLPHRAMLHRDFITPDEIARVRAFIATLHPGDTVNFGWTGLEPFFFADLARAGAHWTMSRYSVTQVRPFRTYNWRVACDSSEWPAFLFRFDLDHPRQGADTGCVIIDARGAGPK